MTHDDALPALPIGEAEVLWHEPDPVMPERPGKIIDASHAFMDAAPLGTRLYSAEQMRAYARAVEARVREKMGAQPAALIEAVDTLLECAPCECPHRMREERGEHLSHCYLFDLNVARSGAGEKR